MLTNKIAKACLFGGDLSLSVLGSTTAMAANQQSYNIDVFAHVPSDDFQVEPVESGWINQAQEIEYDITTSKLKAFEKQFQYKNVSGGIQATLMNTDSNGDAILSNGTDIIPLKVEPVRLFFGVTPWSGSRSNCPRCLGLKRKTRARQETFFLEIRCHPILQLWLPV